MAWTAPRTWATNELVTATLLNEQLRDNLLALKSPPAGFVTVASDLTTTSTSWVDVTGATATIATTGGRIVAFFSARVGIATADFIRMRFALDGTGAATIFNNSSGTSYGFIMFSWSGVASGSHTVKVQWNVSAGTGNLYGNTYANAALFVAEMG